LKKGNYSLLLIKKFSKLFDFQLFIGISSAAKQNIIAEVRNESFKVRFNETRKNGVLPDSVNVTFLSHIDGGKCLLTNAIKALAMKTLNSEIDVESIKQDLIDKQIYGV
jgi:hypothetical protein